jgi:DNA-binding transcriptional ArsR family regulator
VRRDDLGAGRPQQPAQDEREQDRIVELPRDRDEVRHEVDRADEVEQEPAEDEPCPPRDARIAEQAANDAVRHEARERGRIAAAARGHEHEHRGGVEGGDERSGDEHRGSLTPAFVSAYLRLVPTYGTHGLAALGDPTRRAIFERLAGGPRAVGELADGLPVSRPAVSQHLKVLKAAGLVVDRRDGTRRLYQLDLTGIEAVRGYFDTLWTQALAAFKTAVEKEDR